uniref:Ribbon-helix-helix protein, CopG family n=1 Tax=Fervidicoccus fontis TaxID=683846 RepID=A0A7J3ZKF9_9CREN
MRASLSFTSEGSGSDVLFLEIREKKTVSLKLDKETYAWLERFWREKGFSSRSHFLRYLAQLAINGNIPSTLEHEKLYLMSCSPSKTVTFKLDEQALERLDSIVKKYGFYNRSDLLRLVLHLLREREERGSTSKKISEK